MTNDHLSFAIQGFVTGEATGLGGIVALCFIAALVASVVVAISK
jgi:hypothetical protein